ncbi:hypothetical protein [Polaromonas sp. YR568]|uniref:hypothetical protein n=1 Tax=Polaromonas sp. YR568 TaxID=1855301 RepID=UPI00398BDB54
MRNYWLTQDLLQAVGVGFLLLALIGIGLALWLPKKWWGKLLAVLAVGFLIAIPLYNAQQENQQQQVEVDLVKERYAEAKALFEERCRTAGEKIFKTIENVDGVLLANLRPLKIDDASQFDADDQYGYNVGGEEYIRYYLIGSSDLTSRYQFVEATQEGTKYRFTTALPAAISREYWTKGGEKVPVEATPVGDFSAPYTIEWKDISTKSDRDAWIAGGALRITDTRTGELLGVRIGYLFEAGMGSTAGQRSPWPWARYYAPSCPSVKEHNRVFVEKVLKPSKETNR